MRIEATDFQGIVLIQDKDTPLSFERCVFHGGLRVYRGEQTAFQLLSAEMELESCKKRLKEIEEEGL